MKVNLKEENEEVVKKLVISDISLGNRAVATGTYIWVFGKPRNGHSLVEIKGERYEVLASSLVDTPVPAPMDKLNHLDPCFSEVKQMKELYADDKNLYRIMECRHGNLFLEETITGVGWYSRLIFIGKLTRDTRAYIDFWERHRYLSNNELHLRGIGM